MSRFVSLLAVLLPVSALAQEQGVPAPVLQALSKDLAQMQQAVVEAQADDGNLVAVKAPTTAIYSKPERSSLVIDTAEGGEPFRVVQRNGAWLKVQTDSNTSGWLPADAARPLYSPESMSIPSSEQLFAKLTDMASKMRDSYRNNPYISISGFTVEIGVPPSVSLDFEFKK